MGIKNFETGVLVQKFDQGSANCVHFFSKAHINKTSASTGTFYTEKFAKIVFLKHKGTAVWPQNQISAKNPIVKKNLFWDTTFSRNSAASLLSCLSEKKVQVFPEKFYIFGPENFLKIRFYSNSMTNLIFFKNRQIYKTPAASTWFYFDITNKGGKEWKRKIHEIVFA